VTRTTLMQQIRRSEPQGVWRTAGHVLGRILLHIVVTGLGLFFALPLLWMISTSLKISAQVYVVPPQWIPNPVRFMNYVDVLTRVRFGHYLLNTLQYALPSIVGVVVSCSLVAYGFSRIRWQGRDTVFFLCIATMMIPFQVQMIPLYIVFRDLGWLDTYRPLIVPAFFGSAYYIFLLRQFYLTIPQELSDAARVDGCSELGIYARIILPLSKPALAVVALYQFMGAWNDYLGPLIYLNDQDKFPLALGLQVLHLASYTEQQRWPYLMAASTMMIAPVILIFYLTQRAFVEGITLTGIKG
jgi:multiple sugar transport system permease protein